jgi:predicted acetyltransferase
MNTKIVKATMKDYEDVIDLGNYVFSHDHRPHDFPALLPKLYKREYFMDGITYLVKEDDRIRAAIGAYPLEMNVSGVKLPGRGIGMVSVHPYHRGKGYMKALMNAALEDMERDGVTFSCLAGQRQRYGYFGYRPAGTRITFTVDSQNLRHTAYTFERDLSLRRVDPGDSELLDAIFALHERKPAYFTRPRARLFDILSSWDSEIRAISSGGRLIGYFVLRQGDDPSCADMEISELYPELDANTWLSAMSLLLRETPDGQALSVTVQPFERELLRIFASFAESYEITPAYMYRVFDQARFSSAFAALTQSLPKNETPRDECDTLLRTIPLFSPIFMEAADEV